VFCGQGGDQAFKAFLIKDTYIGDRFANRIPELLDADAIGADERTAKLFDELMPNKRKETEMAEIENPTAFAKAVLNNGHNPKMTKRDMYIDIARRAEAQRLQGETEAQAFSRYITKDPDGIALFSVHKVLSGPDFEFPRPEVTKADDAPTPALDKLKQLADAHRRDNPGVTAEGAFAHVYTSQENADLVRQSKVEASQPDMTAAEQSSIDAARRWGVEGQFRPAGSTGRTEQRVS